MRFADRQQAGGLLVNMLVEYKGKTAVVLGLPRGGVVVADVIAKQLGLPLGLVIVRKLGHPSDPEFAVGAIAENCQPVLNYKEVIEFGNKWLENAVKDARRQIIARKRQYSNLGFNQPDLKNKIAIIADDGIATGLTMKAALNYLNSEKVSKIIVAVPVMSRDSYNELQEFADIITLDNPDDFYSSVGAHYYYFRQIEDSEVTDILSSYQYYFS